MTDTNTRSSAAGYVTGLKLRISSLESDILYLENEKVDTLVPSYKCIDFGFVVSELLMQNIEHVKKHGMTEKARDSRDKLMFLLEASEYYKSIANSNNSLKISNRALLGENQYLQKQIAEYKRQENLSV